MIRRPTILLTALAATATLTGCSTFQTDVVASVDGTDLDRAEYSALLADVTVGPDATTDAADRVDGGTAREVLLRFVANEALQADLAALGVEVPDVGDTGATGFDALQNELGLVAQAWQSVPPTDLLDETAREAYALGHETTGVICPAHILVESEEDADEVMSRLDAGEDFAALAAEVSTDPGSGAAGGFLGCLPSEQMAVAFVPEFADAALDAAPGEVVGPVETDFGYHIIRLVPADELTADMVPIELLAQVRFASFEDRFDITIDPTIGTWDPVLFVAPLS